MNLRIPHGLCAPTKFHVIRTTYPGILGACCDSRAEASKHYTPAFAVELGGQPIHFDFSRDIFEFGDVASLMAFSQRNSPFTGSKMEADLVQVVGMTVERKLDERIFKLLCSNFGNMKVLMTREGNDELPRVPDTQPLSEFTPDQILHAWPTLRQQIRDAIKARGGEWRSWKPPLVVRGTREQWRYHMAGKVWRGMEWESESKEGGEVCRNRGP